MNLLGIVAGRSAPANRAASLLQERLAGCIVRQVDDIPSALKLAGEADHLVFVAALVPDGEKTADELFLPVVEAFPDTRIFLLTHEEVLRGVAELTDRNKIDLITDVRQFQDGQFLLNVTDQVRRFCTVAGIEAPTSQPDRESFIFAQALTDQEIMDRIVAGFDECLGYQPRILIPPGVRLTVEGSRVEEATLALRGQVALERESHAGNVLMHHASTGKIIGLLALTDQRAAFFTSRTTTEVLGIHLTFEQVNYVVQARPETALLIAVLFIRSLDRRLRRSEDIQIEKVELAAQLETEQANLARALTNLEAARAELLAQARFASLGELAAGVAHELNNPMAAIDRTSSHLLQDVTTLIAGAPEPWASHARQALDAANTATSMSTKQARALKREMTEATGDPVLAQRLVLAGIRDTEFARRVAGDESVLAELESAASIGTGLRNLASASRRITELVTSLRSYARPDGDPVMDVDVHETIDESLRLLSHRLHGIDIIRDYENLPHLSCRPGQLSQVWTNLMTNAAEAMAEQHGRAGGGEDGTIGTLTIATRPGDDAGWIRVTISDTGPGIPEHLIERIFEPRFTTKSGQVRFGMGIGLGVCQSIVSGHGGRIRLASSDRGTDATVDLPTEVAT